MVKKNVKENGGVCSYNLILMDCQMPFMDGYEATQEIREFLYSKNILQPIITAVTGQTSKGDVKKCLDSGMNQVSSKPLKADVIKDLLQKLHYLN